MLVLSRKQDEKIIIGDSITLMVVSIQGDKVRLGIEAPKEVPIHREEIYQAIQQGKARQANDSTTEAKDDTDRLPQKQRVQEQQSNAGWFLKAAAHPVTEDDDFGAGLFAEGQDPELTPSI